MGAAGVGSLRRCDSRAARLHHSAGPQPFTRPCLCAPPHPLLPQPRVTSGATPCAPTRWPRSWGGARRRTATSRRRSKRYVASNCRSRSREAGGHRRALQCASVRAAPLCQRGCPCFFILHPPQLTVQVLNLKTVCQKQARLLCCLVLAALLHNLLPAAGAGVPSRGLLPSPTVLATLCSGQPRGGSRCCRSTTGATTP